MTKEDALVLVATKLQGLDLVRNTVNECKQALERVFDLLAKDEFELTEVQIEKAKDKLVPLIAAVKVAAMEL